MLPGDFFNANQYRDDANYPFHNKEQVLRDEQGKRQRQAEEEQSDRRGGRAGTNRANVTGPREKRCWCAIADAVSSIALEDGSFWVLSDGRLTPDTQAMVHEPTQRRHQLAQRNRFGHSMLHLFASGKGLQMQLLAMVLNCDDATLLVANTAGQTFLHVLAPGWFVGLHKPYSPQLLAHLRSHTRQPPPGSDGSDAVDDPNGPGSGNAIAHLVYATDVYGRCFFRRRPTTLFLFYYSFCLSVNCSFPYVLLNPSFLHPRIRCPNLPASPLLFPSFSCPLNTYWSFFSNIYPVVSVHR